MSFCLLFLLLICYCHLFICLLLLLSCPFVYCFCYQGKLPYFVAPPMTGKEEEEDEQQDDDELFGVDQVVTIVWYCCNYHRRIVLLLFAVICCCCFCCYYCNCCYRCHFSITRITCCYFFVVRVSLVVLLLWICSIRDIPLLPFIKGGSVSDFCYWYHYPIVIIRYIHYFCNFYLNIRIGYSQSQVSLHYNCEERSIIAEMSNLVCLVF